MTKELASVLKSLLHNMSFLPADGGVMAGIVQPVIDVKYQENTNLAIAKKMPVSYDTTLGKSTFLGMERQLIPDKSRKCILYFEDFGSSTNTTAKANVFSWITNIRLVCWINKTALGLEKYSDVTAKSITEILERLILGTGINDSGILKLFVYNPRILIQDANIFSRYNYAEEVVQYLRPPFEYFAIDLTCRYEARRVPCMGGVKTSNQLIPVRIPILIKDSPSNARQELDNGWFIKSEYPSGTTLTVPILKNYNILQVVHNRNIVDGIVDNPLDYDETTATWDFSTNPIGQLNEGDEIFIWAALPEKNQ